jgi:nitronate monooxygenase
MLNDFCNKLLGDNPAFKHYSAFMSSLLDVLGWTAPIIQAPMAGVQNHRLTAAVCQAGGLGSLPAAMLSTSDLLVQLHALQQATAKAYNVNFFCHAVPAPDMAKETAWLQHLQPYYQELGLEIQNIPSGPGRVPFNHEAADVLQAFRPAVISFHFGLPSADLMARVRSWGSLIFSSATTVDEALWLQAQGVDAIIAQGLEAGGHRGMFLTEDVSSQVETFTLLTDIVHAVRLPVIAAGGIANATSVQRAKAAGAAGVQIGTAYLCSDEATTSVLHREALQTPNRQTALTPVFTGRPARGIINRAMQALEPLSHLAPAFPLATAAMTPLRTAAEARGRSDFSPLWAGQSNTPIANGPASEITRTFIAAWQD